MTAAWITKGILIAMPVASVAVVMAKLNLYVATKYPLDNIHREFGWPLVYLEYVSTQSPSFPWSGFTGDIQAWSLPALGINIFIAMAVLASVYPLLKQVFRDWPKVGFKAMFIVTTVTALIVCLKKFEGTIRPVLGFLTGLPFDLHLFGTSWLDGVPLLLGSAALCYGTIWLIYTSCKALYHFVIPLVQPPGSASNPDE